MNKKSITVTIDGIPEHILHSIWQYAIREARHDLGVKISPTDAVNIDFPTLMEYDREETFSSLMACVTAICAIHQFKIHNVKVIKK